MGGVVIVCRVLIGNSEGNRRLRRSRRRWQCSIEIDLKSRMELCGSDLSGTR